MGATSRYDWPYPEASDAPNVPADLTGLAMAVEETMGAVDDRLTTLTGLSQSVMQYSTVTRVSSSIMSIPTSTWTAIIFDTAQFNLPVQAPGFTLSSPTRITCTQTGLYSFIGFAGFALNANGSRAVAVRINGNASYTAITSGMPPPDIEWYGCIAVEARLTKDDFVELVVRHSKGSNLSLDTVQPRLSVRRML